MPAFLGLATAVGAVGSIYSGISGMQASNQEASLQRQQGDEAVREAQINAANEAHNQTQAVQRQRLAFLANGVSLEGSPSMVLASSKAYGQSQVDEILRQGSAKAALSYGEAQITQNKGRTALIAGLLQGAGGLSKAGGQAYEAGFFDSPSTGLDNPGQ